MPLQIIRQDITKMQVDAIVNTTNEEMVGYINYYKPDAVVFITDLYGWFIRWSRKKSFKDFVTEYNECIDNSTIVATGKVSSSKIVVCKRPDRRGYSSFGIPKFSGQLSNVLAVIIFFYEFFNILFAINTLRE